MVKIGEKVQEPVTGVSSETEMNKFTGYVAYINEDKSWYMVEFHFPGGIVRECYKY